MIKKIFFIYIIFCFANISAPEYLDLAIRTNSGVSNADCSIDAESEEPRDRAPWSTSSRRILSPEEAFHYFCIGLTGKRNAPFLSGIINPSSPFYFNDFFYEVGFDIRTFYMHSLLGYGYKEREREAHKFAEELKKQLTSMEVYWLSQVFNHPRLEEKEKKERILEYCKNRRSEERKKDDLETMATQANLFMMAGKSLKGNR